MQTVTVPLPTRRYLHDRRERVRGPLRAEAVVLVRAIAAVAAAYLVVRFLIGWPQETAGPAAGYLALVAVLLSAVRLGGRERTYTAVVPLPGAPETIGEVRVLLRERGVPTE